MCFKSWNTWKLFMQYKRKDLNLIMHKRDNLLINTYQNYFLSSNYKIIRSISVKNIIQFSILRDIIHHFVQKGLDNWWTNNLIHQIPFKISTLIEFSLNLEQIIKIDYRIYWRQTKNLQKDFNGYLFRNFQR